MRSSRRCALLMLAAIVTSCAGPAQLARISERELKAGQLERAYEHARRGVNQDPTHQGVRRAMTAAAEAIVADYEDRVLALATSGDTLGAAERDRELREFRAGLGQYKIEAPLDSTFAAQEVRILQGAASIEYRLGDQAMGGGRPKEAFFHFQGCSRIVPGYLDVWKRMEESRAASMTRVAILPFENQTDVRDLSREMADVFCREVAIHIDREEFGFTELVSLDEVYASMTVRESESLTPEAAIRIAQGVEADRIMLGRFHGLRASSALQSFDHPIYHKESWRDSAGRTHDRYVESHFYGVTRERAVTLRYDFQVLDTGTRAVVASRTESFEAFARVAWTDFRAEGDCDDYVLYTPEMERDHSDRVRVVTERWKECFGDWKLADMLEQSRRDRHRAHYDSRYRREFHGRRRGRPVLMGELPSEDDLARVALQDAWKPLIATLQDIDLKD